MTNFILFDEIFYNDNIKNIMDNIDKSLELGNNIELHISSNGGLKRASNILFLFIKDRNKHYKDKIKIIVCDENASSASNFILRCILDGVNVNCINYKILLLFHFTSMELQTRDSNNKIYIKRLEKQKYYDELNIEILENFINNEDLVLLKNGETICIEIGEIIEKVNKLEDGKKEYLLKLMENES